MNNNIKQKLFIFKQKILIINLIKNIIIINYNINIFKNNFYLNNFLIIL